MGESAWVDLYHDFQKDRDERSLALYASMLRAFAPDWPRLLGFLAVWRSAEQYGERP